MNLLRPTIWKIELNDEDGRKVFFFCYVIELNRFALEEENNEATVETFDEFFLWLSRQIYLNESQRLAIFTQYNV